MSELVTSTQPPGTRSRTNFSIDGRFITMSDVASWAMTGDGIGSGEMMTEQLAVPPHLRPVGRQPRHLQPVVERGLREQRGP